MAKLTWDDTGKRFYETGVDQGVLYVRDSNGAYPLGVPWNGLINVTESPEGAEPNPQYADNMKYVNILSTEEFKGTIEAFTYPEEFAECDGSAQPKPGAFIGQQERKTFGLVYRTKIGNDLTQEAGYKLHIVWGAVAAPSEKAYATINDSPEPTTFSWEITTTPVNVTGYLPTSTMMLDSIELGSVKMAAIEAKLFGDATNAAALLMPDAILALITT